MDWNAEPEQRAVVMHAEAACHAATKPVVGKTPPTTPPDPVNPTRTSVTGYAISAVP